MESISIIGGADGPTSVFLAGTLGNSWISIMGLIVVLMLILPNLIFKVKKQKMSDIYQKDWMDTVEKITRITTMFFMIFQFGGIGDGFPSVLSFLVYYLGNMILLIVYWILWIGYKKKQTPERRLTLVKIPCFVYLLCGLTLQHWLLIVSAVIFSVVHIKIQQRKMELLIWDDEEEEASM